ncbi:MAG: ABC transporter ATP-binding protein [Verrucomicrobia bacterium]|nr:ABC transporter ATP-binding protein [Verrucomicrobiota bacterium]
MNEEAKTTPREKSVEVVSVTKSYRLGARVVPVLRGIDLVIAAGEFVALRGASGAGKSTLLHLMGGLDRADSGRIFVEGAELSTLSGGALSAFRNARVGFVFQAYCLLPELDALENVCLPARLARVDASEASTRAVSLLDKVGLRGRLDHRPLELSGGEQQRVAIARALINRPKLLLADEPTGNLDSRTGAEIIELLIQLQREEGGTLVIATHDERVASRAPRQIELGDGVVV